MTEKQIKDALSQCLNHVVQKYMFSEDTEDIRRTIVYEFVDRCAEFGHGVEAEYIIIDGMFKGVNFLHETGVEGSIHFRVISEHEV